MKSGYCHPIVLILFLFASCGKGTVEEQNTRKSTDPKPDTILTITTSQANNAGVALGKLESKEISSTIKVNGVLDVPPQQLVSISVPIGGFLKNTSVLQGTRIKKGQLIAAVENLDFIQLQQDYLEAKSQYELSKSDFERQEQLAKENVNSQKVFQQSRSNFTIWKAKYSALREKLKFIHINIDEVEKGNFTSSIDLYSPINGYVTQVNVNIGKFVSPTDVIFKIVDTEHLHAELIVFEKDVPRLKIGQRVRFTLANETKERLAAVYLIGREISADRTVQVHCHISKEDSELLPGMYLSALVETGDAMVTALPTEAVVDYQGKKYVFTAVNKNTDTHAFELCEVSTGDAALDFVEVRVPDSLRNRDFVVKGAYALLAQMKNRPEE
jgi:cobalt-zinc-cadmium efflux system membrane fusion protein